MKLVFTYLFCLFIGAGYAQLNNVIYVTDTIPAMNAEVESALNVYKLRFEAGNETDLMRNFDVYRRMDSLYGKSWIKKLKNGMGANTAWADFVGKTKAQTVFTDNWNWTKYEYYSVGLLKSIETKTCGYNLRCGVRTKKYSRKGEVTSNTLKNISKDEK